MEQIDYLNVNINKLVELIRQDTDNYKNLKTSLCGRAFELENKTLVADKIDIEKLSNLIDKENAEFQNKLKEIEDEKTKGFSLFSGKIKKSKQIKEVTKEHENKLMILNSRLNRKQQQYEENRILLQEIIDKLANRGIIWHHARKIIAKKIKENSLEKPKPKLKPVKLDSSEDVKRTGTKLNGEGTEDDTNKTFKEKNFFDMDEVYRILGLTPEEFREYQIILQYIYSNRERLRDVEISLKLRLALSFDGHLGKFKNLALYASDFALYNDIFKYLTMNDGADYANNFKRYMTAKINNDRLEIGKMDKFFRVEAMNLMQNSGFESEFIQRNYGAFEKEIRELYTSPSEMRKIIDRMNYPGQSYQQMHLAFQELVKQEITFRLRTKDMNQQILLQSNIKGENSVNSNEQGIFDTLFGSTNNLNGSIHPLDEYHDHHDNNYYDHLIHHEYNKNEHHHRHRPYHQFDDRQNLFEVFEDSLDDYESHVGYYADNYDDDIVDTDTTDDNSDNDNSDKMEEEQSYLFDND